MKKLLLPLLALSVLTACQSGTINDKQTLLCSTWMLDSMQMVLADGQEGLFESQQLEYTFQPDGNYIVDIKEIGVKVNGEWKVDQDFSRVELHAKSMNGDVLQQESIHYLDVQSIDGQSFICTSSDRDAKLSHKMFFSKK